MISLVDHVGLLLGFVDCVAHLRQGDVFRQVAAYGPKRDESGGVLHPLVQRMDEGLVGAAAALGEPLLTPEVAHDSRYPEDVVLAGSVVFVSTAQAMSRLRHGQ